MIEKYSKDQNISMCVLFELLLVQYNYLPHMTGLVLALFGFSIISTACILVGHPGYNQKAQF